MTSPRYATSTRTLPTILLASLGGGFLFHLAHLPVAWLLGPMLAGVTLASFSKQPMQIPLSARAGAQVIIGVAVGLRLSREAFLGLGGQLPVLLLLVGATGALSMLNGLLLKRFAGVDAATGFLGSIPGAASSVVAISADLGADPRLVAVLQYIRVLLVALTVPFVVEQAAPRLLGGAGLSPLAFPGAGETLGGLAGSAATFLLLAYAIGGWLVGRLLRLPSASFLGPFSLTAAGTFLLGSVPFPDWLFNAALLVLGVWIGIQFDGPFIRKLGRIALVETILVLLLVATTAVLGFASSRLLGVDPVTAVLASSPGAMEAMVALSLKLGAHTPLVISMQMLRFLAMLFTGPWIANRLVRLVTKEGSPPPDHDRRRPSSPASSDEPADEISKPSP